MIEDDIKPEYFKTHIIGKILRMTALLEPTQIGISCNNGFYEHVIDSLLDLFTVMP